MSFQLESVPQQPGRVAIITGANTGLGFENARAFAQKGITTVMACRSQERGQAAHEKIKAEFPGADLALMLLDLSELSSVRAFAEAFRGKYDKLDLLVLNAGIMMPPFSLSKDGFESQMAANYTGHFLLTSLLLDLMPDAAASRIVTLSSNAHKMGDKVIRWDDLQWSSGYTPMKAYAQTKLACLMFANALDHRLKANGKKTIALSAHPGASMTELGRHMNPFLAKTIGPIFGALLGQPADKGALPQIQAALDENAQGGTYYGPSGMGEMKGPPRLVQQMPYAQDKGPIDRLWAASCEMTGATFDWQSSSSQEA